MTLDICGIIRKRQQLGIYDGEEDLDRIVNIDETPIFFEMTTDKTYNKKGAKVVSIETKGNEKKLITCVLAVSASGKKLIPTLIFKGGRDGNLEARYKNLECVKNKKIVIYFQYNAWCDEAIFKKWVKDVYLVYEEEEIKKRCTLFFCILPYPPLLIFEGGEKFRREFWTYNTKGDHCKNFFSNGPLLAQFVIF